MKQTLLKRMYSLIEKCDTRLSWLTEVQTSYLQANATLVMRRACATFVVSTKLNIQTNSTDITMKRTISVNSADSAFIAMVGMIIITSQMFTHATEITGEFCSTITTKLAKRLHFFAVNAFHHLCVTWLKFLLATSALVVMATMTRPKLVTAFKFDVTMSFIVTAQPVTFQFKIWISRRVMVMGMRNNTGFWRLEFGKFWTIVAKFLSISCAVCPWSIFSCWRICRGCSSFV